MSRGGLHRKNVCGFERGGVMLLKTDFALPIFPVLLCIKTKSEYANEYMLLLYLHPHLVVLEALLCDPRRIYAFLVPPLPFFGDPKSKWRALFGRGQLYAYLFPQFSPAKNMMGENWGGTNSAERTCTQWGKFGLLFPIVFL
eukprot:GEMP01095502.1.p1 GENE.GEMP01095502.1~~GEMP01095502.1.p1  ORF type:complete len:142 (+),score=8.72 GEMP01095502.1:298-723(+)